MARVLTGDQTTGLANETVHTTVKIVPTTGSTLYLASADGITISSQAYDGRLKVTDALRMLLTKAIDKVSFEIENIDLVLGQTLITNDKFFINSVATFGAWHDNPTSGEWHDEKIVGTITNSEVNGDFILCKFVSALDASDYGGIAIASIFTGIPPLNINNNIGPISDFSDLLGSGFAGKGKLDLFGDDINVRHFFPEYEGVF